MGDKKEWPQMRFSIQMHNSSKIIGLKRLEKNFLVGLCNLQQSTMRIAGACNVGATIKKNFTDMFHPNKSMTKHHLNDLNRKEEWRSVNYWPSIRVKKRVRTVDLTRSTSIEEVDRDAWENLKELYINKDVKKYHLKYSNWKILIRAQVHFDFSLSLNETNVSFN